MGFEQYTVQSFGVVSADLLVPEHSSQSTLVPNPPPQPHRPSKTHTGMLPWAEQILTVTTQVLQHSNYS